MQDPVVSLFLPTMIGRSPVWVCAIWQGAPWSLSSSSSPLFSDCFQSGLSTSGDSRWYCLLLFWETPLSGCLGPRIQPCSTSRNHLLGRIVADLSAFDASTYCARARALQTRPWRRLMQARFAGIGEGRMHRRHATIRSWGNGVFSFAGAEMYLFLFIWLPNRTAVWRCFTDCEW